MQYADISELDDKALYVRVTWNKMISYASTFTREFLAVEEGFISGKYGPEWTFARWLGVKCGMSYPTTYRIIEELHRVATDDEREKIKMVVADQQRAKYQRKADSRATQLAWNVWLSDEKNRITNTQAAWDMWLSDEKIRIDRTQDAWDLWLFDEKTRIADTQSAWDEYQKSQKPRRRRKRRIKVKNEQENKGLRRVTLFSEDSENSEKRVSHVRQRKAVYKAFEQFIVELKKLPKDDLVVCVEQSMIHLGSLVPSNNDEVHVNGHNTEQTHTESTSV